jgi:hypothetical protein
VQLVPVRLLLIPSVDQQEDVALLDDSLMVSCALILLLWAATAFDTKFKNYKCIYYLLTCLLASTDSVDSVRLGEFWEFGFFGSQCTFKELAPVLTSLRASHDVAFDLCGELKKKR